MQLPIQLKPDTQNVRSCTSFAREGLRAYTQSESNANHNSTQLQPKPDLQAETCTRNAQRPDLLPMHASEQALSVRKSRLDWQAHLVGMRVALSVRKLDWLASEAGETAMACTAGVIDKAENRLETCAAAVQARNVG